MAIDNINQLSTEQLLALSMVGNGQLIDDNDTNSTNSTNDESSFAFQSVMEDIIESLKNSKKDNDSSKNIDNLNTASTRESNSKQTDNTNTKNRGLVELNARNTAQKYLTGQKLQDIPMILTNNQFSFSNNSGNISSNRSGANMEKIYDAISNAAKRYGVDSKLILAIIKQESDFDPNSTSSCGATGLMQIMPDNYSHLGITNGYDIGQNINGGTKLLKENLDQYGGNIEMALMAYNGGSGTMKKRGVSSAGDLYKMPTETQNYVPKVMGYYRNGV
jgi:hypothetical protein